MTRCRYCQYIDKANMGFWVGTGDERSLSSAAFTGRSFLPAGRPSPSISAKWRENVKGAGKIVIILAVANTG